MDMFCGVELKSVVLVFPLGCAVPGDFAKAYGAGADFVMSGSMFAAHDESGGELVVRDGKRFKVFYGMSSTTAMEKHGGSVAEYRSSGWFFAMPISLFSPTFVTLTFEMSITQ